MPAILTVPKEITDEYNEPVTITHIKCNDLDVNPENETITIEYWKSSDGVTWGDRQIFEVKNQIKIQRHFTPSDEWADPEIPEYTDTDIGDKAMNQALADITAHWLASFQLSDGPYILNRAACYYLVSSLVFNTTYTMMES